MISVAISAFLVWGTLMFLERGKDSLIDGWVASSFVIVPALVIWGLAMAGGIFGLSPQLLILALPLYIIFPALVIRYALDYKWGRAWGYGGIVFVIAIIVQFSVSHGLSRLTALVASGS